MLRTSWTITAALAACLLMPAAPARSGVIDDALNGMAGNSWQKINLNTYQSVWTPLAQRATPTDPMSNISAWSGAAWDASRNSLYIWGGDHSSVGDEGNEVYIFSGTTGKWSRGALPSAITSTNGIEHTVDGIKNAPLSGESWDNVVFLRNVDRLAVLGVSREGQTWRDPATGLTTGPYFWDPAKADPNKVGGLTGSQVNPGAFPNVVGGEMWQNRQKVAGPTDFLRGTSAYMDVNGKDVVYMTDTEGFLWRYTVRDLNPANDTWEMVGRRPMTGEKGHGAAAIDAANNMYLHALTATTFGFWDMDRPGDPNENREIKITPTVLGSLVPPGFSNFGIEYDAALGAFVLWDGSDSLWRLTPPSDLDANDDGILDVATGWTLEQILVSGNGPNIPTTKGQYTGVYGKWLYLAEYDAYLGVIDPISGDVFLYKPRADTTAVPEPGAALLLFAALLALFALRARRSER